MIAISSCLKIAYFSGLTFERSSSSPISKKSLTDCDNLFSLLVPARVTPIVTPMVISDSAAPTNEGFSLRISLIAVSQTSFRLS